MLNIINPKKPIGSGWHLQPPPREWVAIPVLRGAELWLHHPTGIVVISAVEVVEKGRGPEYHLSMTIEGISRCTSAEAAEVLMMFDMFGAEEDNHVPDGIARHFWRPVNENLIGIECECKDEEPKIVEDKGDYVWRGVTK